MIARHTVASPINAKKALNIMIAILLRYAAITSAIAVINSPPVKPWGAVGPIPGPPREAMMTPPTFQRMHPTRIAVQDAIRSGVRPFCVTIDAKAPTTCPTCSAPTLGCWCDTPMNSLQAAGAVCAPNSVIVRRDGCDRPARVCPIVRRFEVFRYCGGARY